MRHVLRDRRDRDTPRRRNGGGTYVLYPSWQVDMGGGRWERTCVSIDDITECEWQFVE